MINLHYLLLLRRLKTDEDKIIKNIEKDGEKQEELKEIRQGIQEDIETLEAGILEVNM